MSETIPEDVMAEALELARDISKDSEGYRSTHEIAETIARAILSERERCALLVERGVRANPYVTDHRTETVAAAIRNPMEGRE